MQIAAKNNPQQSGQRIMYNKLQ